MNLDDYLKEKLAPSTAKRYLIEIDLFFASIENPKTATYSQVMDYIGKLRTKQKHLNSSLSAIKSYYKYLTITEQRKDNPAQSIKLRDQKNRDVQLQDLFKTEELEELLNKQERSNLLKNRNKLIFSLLIYQALTLEDIIKLELDHLNLEEGVIRITAKRRTNERTLKLKSKQTYWLMNYLNVERIQLLRNKESPYLLVSYAGLSPLKVDGISHLIETQKHKFPGRKLIAQTIRQSVISNLLNEGKDLRIVQAFAGHKNPSATEKYKQTEVEDLKNQVLKYHPLQ